MAVKPGYSQSSHQHLLPVQIDVFKDIGQTEEFWR